MRRRPTARFLAEVLGGLLLLWIPLTTALAQLGGHRLRRVDSPAALLPEEIIYGHKDGLALTMLVLRPPATAPARHRAIVSVVSSGYQSSLAIVPTYEQLAQPLLRRGDTVFLVLHGSSPTYTAPDAVVNVRRAVQFIRYYARRFGIASNRIGITGASAGAHLALLVATQPDIATSTSPQDSVETASARVQAVACFFPLTDLLNFGSAGYVVALDKPNAGEKPAGGALRFPGSRYDLGTAAYGH